MAEKLEAIFICQEKKLVTFSRAQTGMNEIESVLHQITKLSTRLVRQLLPQIFDKLVASKAKTKQYFEAAKDLLCQPGRAEQTGKAFQRFLG